MVCLLDVPPSKNIRLQCQTPPALKIAFRKSKCSMPAMVGHRQVTRTTFECCTRLMVAKPGWMSHHMPIPTGFGAVSFPRRKWLGFHYMTGTPACCSPPTLANHGGHGRHLVSL